MIQPNSGNLRLEKNYQHDGYGNIVYSDLKGYAGTGTQTRVHRTEFDSQGRFVTKSINALGHTEQKTYEPLLGMVTLQTGPNGLPLAGNTMDLDEILEQRADGTTTTTTTTV